ncbi:MAG: ATP-binding protein [Epsilonproteobacteria bacterium]|nr:ATP-binding protein [Campylobacterota bacterium]
MIQRKIRKKLILALKNFKIITLNGARQSGKTTLVRDIAKEHNMDYITLDDPQKLNLAQIDPKNFLEFYAKKALVIDEIQLAPQLIPYLKILVDKEDKKGLFLLTGSADFIKMKKVTESLAGRMVRYKLYPLSNAELRDKKDNIIEQLFNQEFNQLQNYSSLIEVIESTIRGGYPEIINYPRELRDDWFSSYIESRIQKDILELKTISLSKLHMVKLLLRLLATYDAELLNYDKIAKKLQIDNKTVLSYIELLEAMYIIKIVPSYHLNASLRVIKSPKIHFLDTGLLCYLLHVDSENLFLHKDEKYGSLIENFVYSELLKESSYANSRVDIYHFRDLRKREVDLVLEYRNGGIIGIEVKAKAIIKKNDLKGMIELAKASKDRFLHGIVFYGGDEVSPIVVDDMLFYCIPLGVLG